MFTPWKTGPSAAKDQCCFGQRLHTLTRGNPVLKSMSLCGAETARGPAGDYIDGVNAIGGTSRLLGNIASETKEVAVVWGVAVGFPFFHGPRRLRYFNLPEIGDAGIFLAGLAG